MDAAEVLRLARGRAGLTQRALARATGVAQPTIARIERGQVQPRVDTLERLLEACGSRLAAEAIPGFGVDRSQFGRLRSLTPRQRLELLRGDVAGLVRLERLARR